MGMEAAPRVEPAVATHRDASHRVFPPLTLMSCHQETPRWQDHPLVHHTGHTQREREALGDRTFSHKRMAPCVVGKGPPSPHRSDAANRTGRCVCCMPPASLTAARVPCACHVKAMAPPPKNRVGSVPSCILCHRWSQKNCHLRVFVPPILSFGVIGRALSLAARGYNGNAATWSRWKRCPFHRFARHLRLSRGQSVRIGV
jgi:hypothetical protein